MQNMRYIYFTYSTSHDTLKLEKMQEGDLLKMNRSHAKYIAGLPVGAHKIHPNCNFLKKSPTPHFRGKILQERGVGFSLQEFAVRAKKSRKKPEIPAKVVQESAGAKLHLPV